MEKKIDIITQLHEQVRHLTLAQQSEKTGVTMCTLSRIWRGELPPKLETMEKIADALGMELCLRKKKRGLAK